MSFHSVIRIWYKFLFFIPYSISQNAALLPNFTFSDNEGTPKFNHLVVDKTEGVVFIGAVNRLYQLSPNLDLIVNYTTGPYSTSLNCSTSDHLPGVKRELDNHNKALLIDYTKSRLIACGSNFQGICTVHDIKNISNGIIRPCEPIVANDENASTVTFIAQAYPKSTPSMSMLYVGATYVSNSSHPSKVPAIATRSLENDTLFQIDERGDISGANISLNQQYLRTYPINYVYGFSFGPYSYFLTTQKKSTDVSSSYISKIIRICNKPDNSYIEIPIECADTRNNVYNLVQTAFIAKPDDELAGSIDNALQDPFLVAIFAKSKEPVGNKSNEPSKHNALCKYSLSAIDYKFIQNAVKCLKGNGYIGEKFIPPDKNCTKRDNVTIDSDFCWFHKERPLGGVDPVTEVPVSKFDTISTAITVGSTGKFTVVFVGTSNGYLQKYVVTEKKQKYAEIPIDEGTPVISLQFDVKKENLYVMTEHKLVKVPVQICHEYQTDQDCIEIGDPYCGWCSQENKCTLLDECNGARENSSLWIPYNIHTLLTIKKVDPGTAPINYVTNLTLTIENFSLINEDIFCAFTISDKITITNGTRMKDKMYCLTPDPKYLPSTQKDHSKVKAKLTIQTKNITDLAHTKYKFYDCNAITFCLPCVEFKTCYWYVEDNTCVDKRMYNSSKPTSENGLIHLLKDCPNRTDKSINTFPTLYLAVVAVILIILASVLFLLFKKLTKTTKKRKKMQRQMDELELCVAAECKEAFAELQTEISDSRVSGMPEDLPFWDYRTYVMKILFSNISDHSNILCDKPELTHKKKELQLFYQLIANKTFLLIFIRTLENDEGFSLNDRVYVASMIMITLQNEMEYCTDVIKTLLASLIKKSMKRVSQPKLLLRRSDSVVEKMLSAWFTFLLHKFLLECAGKPLFTLFKAIKQQVNKGPIDEITSEARYSLSENKLIRQPIEYASITVYVSVSRQTAIDTGLKSAAVNVPVRMLDCDTISQAKEKAVNSIYFAVNYSQRPKPSELDLELVAELSGNMILRDTDSSSDIQGEWKRRNTLQHYDINEGSLLSLKLFKEDLNQIQSPIAPANNEQPSACDNLKSTIMECASPKICRARYKSVPDFDAYYKEWHLVKPDQPNNHMFGDGSNMVSEVYLTRLLSTKGTLQKFVDDLFEIMLSQTRQNVCFPTAIKYMFDFLDDQARENCISNPQFVHIWKSNCLPLRFWVNLIKNPDFLFDIHKSNIIDSCLSVIAQAFMDSCSVTEHHLGKDSPTAKLLYAKDIPFYKEWVKKYYSDIKAMPPVSRDDMSAMLGKESQLHCLDFNTNAAVYELYKYAMKYKEQLMTALSENKISQKYNIANKLEEVLTTNATANLDLV